MTIKRLFFAIAFLMVSTSIFAQEVMKKNNDGTYIVNTTSLTKDVQGYQGTTPVEIYIKNDVIVKVVPLQNSETPNFFNRVKEGMLKQYEGLPVKNFDNANVDAITGATYSSDAVKENVNRGVKYYLKNKKKIK